MKKDQFNSGLGMRIRQARETFGYTREQLAEMADISVSFLNYIEIGTRGISAGTLAKFCEVLHVSADYLLFEQAEDTSLVQQALVHLDADEREAIENLLTKAIGLIQLSSIKEPKDRL